MGWFSDFISNPIATIGETGQKAINEVGNATKALDQTVRTLPGGWTTAALLAAGYAYDPTLGGYISPDGTAMAAAADVAAADALATPVVASPNSLLSTGFDPTVDYSSWFTSSPVSSASTSTGTGLSSAGGIGLTGSGTTAFGGLGTGLGEATTATGIGGSALGGTGLTAGTTVLGGLGADIGTIGLSASTGSLLPAATPSSGTTLGSIGSAAETASTAPVAAAPAVTSTNTGLNFLANRLLGTSLAGLLGTTGTNNMATTTAANNNLLGGLLGGALTGAGGLMQGSTNAAASQAQADAIRQAGQLAQQQAQFRPVGTTTTFGTSNFTVDPTTGQLTSAGYTLSPQLQAAQNTLMGNQAQNLTDLSTIQNLGRGYLAQSPQEAAQQYIQNQQALLAPLREQQWANLANQDYNRGTTGLKGAQGGTLQSANPYATALANAQSQQDLQLAAQAQQAGQQQALFGQGLLSSAYQPYSTGLQALSGTEQLGQQPFGLSTQLGQLSSAAGARAGQLGLGANQAAAQAALQAGQYNPYASALSGLGGSSLFGTALGNTIGNTALGGALGNLFGGLSTQQLNQAASDWIAANPDIIPTSTVIGNGADILSPDMQALLGL